MSQKISTAAGFVIVGIIVASILVLTNLFMKNQAEIAQLQIPMPVPIQKEIEQTNQAINDSQTEMPAQPNLPKGYTLKNYTITKKLDIKCTENIDCKTPQEYLLLSNCPYTSICLESKCTVVCPAFADDSMNDWKTYRSDQYGFEIKYPPNWIINEKYPDGVISLDSPENIEKQKRAKELLMQGKFMPDIVVTYDTFYPLGIIEDNKVDSGLNMSKSDFSAIIKDYSSLKDYFTNPETEQAFSDYNETNLAGNKAAEVIWNWPIKTYRTMILLNGHLYEITFHRESKSQLSDIDKKILSTFKFLN